MWIFTKYGFFSAVCARQGDGRRADPIDESVIAVRSRSRNHLENLIHRFGEELGRPEIKTYEGSDYQYRVFVTKDGWRKACDAIAAELDYDNFKSEVAVRGGGECLKYSDVLHKVWGVVDDAYWAEGRR